VHARAKSVQVTGGNKADPPITVQLPPTGAADETWKLLQGAAGTLVHMLAVSGASPASAPQAIEHTASE
jgi:hypothetical protein